MSSLKATSNRLYATKRGSTSQPGGPVSLSRDAAVRLQPGSVEVTDAVADPLGPLSQIVGASSCLPVSIATGRCRCQD